MSIPKIAAIVTLVGAIGFVLSSLAYPNVVSDVFFNAATLCIAAGPLIFFGYVFLGLCMEVLSSGQKPEVIAARFPPADRTLTPLGQAAFAQWTPLGLRRERKGPLNPSSGRGNRT